MAYVGRREAEWGNTTSQLETEELKCLTGAQEEETVIAKWRESSGEAFLIGPAGLG